MMDKKFLQILERLQVKTESGAIPWEETADEAMFRTVLDSGMIRIGEGTEYGSVPDFKDDEFIPQKHYTAWLLTPDGRIAQEQGAGPGEPGYDVMRGLYEAARSRARGSEALIDRLLSELETPGAGTR